jgi:hypothetical protein
MCMSAAAIAVTMECLCACVVWTRKFVCPIRQSGSRLNRREGNTVSCSIHSVCFNAAVSVSAVHCVSVSVSFAFRLCR